MASSQWSAKSLKTESSGALDAGGRFRNTLGRALVAPGTKLGYGHPKRLPISTSKISFAGSILRDYEEGCDSSEICANRHVIFTNPVERPPTFVQLPTHNMHSSGIPRARSECVTGVGKRIDQQQRGGRRRGQPVPRRQDGL